MNIENTIPSFVNTFSYTILFLCTNQYKFSLACSRLCNYKMTILGFNIQGFQVQINDWTSKYDHLEKYFCYFSYLRDFGTVKGTELQTGTGAGYQKVLLCVQAQDSQKKKKNVMHELVDQLHSDCFCVENKFRPVWSWFQTKQQWALLNKQVRNKAWLPQTTAKTHIKVIQNLSLLAHDCNYKSQKGGQRGRKITYWRPTWVIYNKTFSHGVMSQIKCHSQ